MKLIRFAAAALLTAAIAVPTSAAVAATHSKTTGVDAWAPADYDTGKIAVRDTAKDGDPVKAEYYRKASLDTKRTLWNHSGSPTKVTSGDGSKVIKHRGCVSLNLKPDRCASWKAQP